MSPAPKNSLHLGWTVRNIALPLLPFTVGAFIRGISVGHIDEAIFSVEELAFSIALLAITVLGSVNRLDDQNIRSGLSALFAFIGIVFVAMYACSVLVTTQAASVRLTGATADAMNVLDTSARALVSRVRWFVYPSALLTIVLALVVKVRFKLDD